MCDNNKGCGTSIGRRGKKFNQTTTPYSTDQSGIILREWCNALSVRNAGNVDIVFNRERLPPGTAKAISMHEDDYYIGTIDLQFQLTGAPTDKPLAYVTQVFYAEKPFI